MALGLEERLGHARASEPFAVDFHGVAALRRKAALGEEVARGVGGLDVEHRSSARGGELFQSVNQRGAHALTREVRVHVKHLDRLVFLERREARDLLLDEGHDGERASELRREGRLVLGARRPCGELVLVVEILGERLDALAKQRGETRSVRRQHRAAARAWGRIAPF